jgi:hypothetical protein
MCKANSALIATTTPVSAKGLKIRSGNWNREIGSATDSGETLRHAGHFRKLLFSATLVAEWPQLKAPGQRGGSGAEGQKA